MRINKAFGIVILVSACALLGMCVKPTTTTTTTVLPGTPTATSASTPIPTPVITPECDRMTWTTNTLEVLSKFPDAITLDLLDALITKYDSIRAPIDCGHSELVDQIDTEVRLGLAAKRTAFMVSEGKAINRNAEAEMHIMNATKELTEYTALP